MTEFIHKSFLLRPPRRLTKSAHIYSLLRSSQKLLSLLGALLHYIIKVMNPLHDMWDTGKHLFTIYYPHNKDKEVNNPTQTFVCATNYLYFEYNLGNFSMAFSFVCDGKACTTELGLVTKKREPSRTALDLSNHFQSPSLLFSLTIFKCTLISEWQFRLILASFLMLADYPSVKLTSEVSLNLSHTTKIV